MTDLKGKDILDGAQFSREDLEHIMAVADSLRRQLQDRPSLDLLKGYVLATLFFEPSTRTRLSFETAMQIPPPKGHGEKRCAAGSGRGKSRRSSAPARIWRRDRAVRRKPARP